MATLMLAGNSTDDAAFARPAVSLRSWLAARWAILFSHPEDFVHCEFELDRWLTVMRRAFGNSSIRPLALARPGRPLDAGWVTQVSGDERAVLVHEPIVGGVNMCDFYAARRLQDEIADMDGRFVMVIDGTLRRHKTFAYGIPHSLPSPLDLVRWACNLRNAHEPRHSSDAPRGVELQMAWPRKQRLEGYRSQSAA